MKISAKKYARVLYELIKDKSELQAKRIIGEFAAWLVTNRDMGKFHAIVEKFGLIWDEKEGITEVELTLARNIDNELKSEIKKYLVGLTGTSKVILFEKI